MAGWNKLNWTPAMDAAIRHVYEAREYGGNKRLALEFGLPAGLVSARAARLGLQPLISNGGRTRPCDFRPEELALIRAHLGEPAAQIRARLYRKGFQRTLCSIRSAIAAHRMRDDWPSTETLIDARDLLTTEAVCAGMGVGAWRIEHWIKRGLLADVKTTGGKRVFSRKTLRTFLLRYPGHWDHRPADRWFLLDILCGDAAAAAALHAVA